MGKLRSLKNNSLSNSKKKNSEINSAENNVEENDIDKIDEVKKMGLVKKVQFKKFKKDNKLPLAKLNKKLDDPNNQKYESIKNNLLKQIKLSDEAGKEEELNFVNGTGRLTNSMLKSILKNDTPTDAIKKLDPKSKGLLLIKKSKNISKKAKNKLKNNVWQERIGLIKNQLKEKADKAKREKTVITGDMKPMIDSLEKKDKCVLFEDKTSNLPNLTRKEKREKNLINQKNKVTQRQSIRNKTSNQDINLFNQLLDYSEFTKNPLDTLKKTFKK